MPIYVQRPHPPPPILTPVRKDNSHIPQWAVCNRSVHQHIGRCHLDTPQPLLTTWKYTPYQGCSDTGTFHSTPTCVGGLACVCMHVWVLACACVCTCMHMSAYSCMHVCEWMCVHETDECTQVCAHVGVLLQLRALDAVSWDFSIVHAVMFSL